MGWLSHDIRYALRQLAKEPGFTVIAILTLGLGIGSVTTIYSVIRNVLIDPFPYKNSDRYVDMIIEDTERSGGGRGALSIPEFLDFKEQSTVFDQVIGTATEGATYTTRQGAARIQMAQVTPNTFEFLGVAPLLGRTPRADEVGAGGSPAAVLSWKMWVNRLAADPGIIGRTVDLNGNSYVVAAVMPPRFTWNVADLWIPRVLHRSDPDAAQRAWWFQATLKPGVTTTRAAAQMTAIAKQRARLHPDEYPKRFTMEVVYVIDWVVGRFRGVLYSLFGAVSLLLLIACCNVANMLLARGTAREKEITIRAALGAGRWRIVRELLVESSLLSIGGAAAGCLIAWAAITAVARSIPPNTIPWESVITLNAPVLLFSVAASMLTPLLFGLAPALYSAHRDLVHGLSSAGKAQNAASGRGRLRSGLVVAEVALSLVLLIGAGLLMRTFVSLVQVDLGFDPKHLLIAALAPPPDAANAAARARLFREAVQRISALPGVAAVAVTRGVPPWGARASEIDIPGRAQAEAAKAVVRFCSGDYFKALGVPLRRGRWFSPADVENGRAVALVNEAFVRKYFGAANPLGATLAIPALEKYAEETRGRMFEIAGVVADTRNQGLQEPPTPEIALPWTLANFNTAVIVVRTTGDPAAFINPVRRAIGSSGGGAALAEIETLDHFLGSFVYARPRFTLFVLGAFASVGLLLVGIGVYSVMAYTVTRQTHEIGIRMALGAQRGDVMQMLLRMCAGVLAIGIGLGILGSFAATRLIAAQLWNVSRYDPITIAAAVLVIAIVGLAACIPPALHAMRVDPADALRYD